MRRLIQSYQPQGVIRRIAAGVIQAAHMAIDSIVTASIQDDAVTADKLADDAVGSNKLTTSTTNVVNGGTVNGATTSSAIAYDGLLNIRCTNSAGSTGDWGIQLLVNGGWGDVATHAAGNDGGGSFYSPGSSVRIRNGTNGTITYHVDQLADT